MIVETSWGKPERAPH